MQVYSAWYMVSVARYLYVVGDIGYEDSSYLMSLFENNFRKEML